MSTDTFEKTNLGWQFFLFQKQVEEWIEYQFSQFQQALPELPRWSISPRLAELLKLLFWLVLGLFIAWIVWRLWQEFGHYIYSWLAGVGNSTVPRAKSPSHEASIVLFLTRSQEFSRQGNYREACRCIYLAMLQQLHVQAIAIQQSSRTDGEYLQLLSSTVTPMQPYETLITTHEQLCFGNAEISPENYQQCRQAYREIFKG
ncbi:DUF4129 domain-containing protein [Cylindrospermum sp. FACHB-282]|uniref:DUF4129 domain-containing protein n=1 Tax=Cylindrospermum sp. FACHB-282 TaxID=2692794 RepID=UPI001687321B|nr:DUF4129 domain-containing protein [Cylindrospermum sp. FACHB-282]MBD2387721.1 DUF4129 domain-containing protein [Cylindrospermum sp. FACHB-282]